MAYTNPGQENHSPESLARTRRLAVLCGILGVVMMTISVVGLMS